MRDYLLSVLYGVVEGLTEFLPVSSTAHIRLAQAACGTPLESGFWKMYAVVIQLGAILSVVVYFRRRLLDLLGTFWATRGRPRALLTHPLSLVLLAFLVTAVPAVLLSKVIKGNLESLWVMGGALVVGGVAMWAIDAWAGRRERADGEAASAAGVTRRMDDMRPWQAAAVGAFQILAAVFPGTSRSMATIAGGQLAGLSRPAALEFSFFLSIPVMFAACCFDLRESIAAPPGDPAFVEVPMNAHWWTVLAIGFAVSFVVALGVVHWFMAWVKRHGFTPFAIYRIVAGAVVLFVAWRSSGPS